MAACRSSIFTDVTVNSLAAAAAAAVAAAAARKTRSANAISRARTGRRRNPRLPLCCRSDSDRKMLNPEGGCYPESVRTW